MNKELSLVTGANGHLGYNLTRLLLSKGHTVRATLRNLKKADALNQLGCEVQHADLMDKGSLVKAFEGVTYLYAVGATFEMWSKNPQKEVYENNVTGTRNLFEAAAKAGVKNILYISSIAALNYSILPAQEKNGYNNDRSSWYYKSKNDSDKLALSLGKEYGIRTVLVLPSAMIGSKAHRLNYSNRLVWQILQGDVPVETNISLNWIDVKDVALGSYYAMSKGRDGERYTLANEKHTTVKESVQIAAKLYPELKLRIPKKVPKFLLYMVAGGMELMSKITGKEPLLQRHYLDMFYGLKLDYDISKAKTELGFEPTPAKEALENAFRYLKEEWTRR
ncbi:NAD-dependent epimerase/dehydratase family protein [Roseivirga sp.]|uniref:NAD-dependent epimerase/dehydratase family protein n=1 Tax=Roseivirga sp. TaxID=1964215 RepID=UPI002B27B916|nr:NAD-dependent epimerase/dehydratase family protein [Roseivirga sp.]